MNELREIISESFYTHPLMLSSALLACILGIIHRKKFQELQLIIFYPIASLIQGFIAYSSWASMENEENLKADVISESLFILLEFLIVYDFFKKIIILNNLKKYIQIIFAFYIIYLLLMWLFTNSFYEHPIKVYLLESLCILFFCFIYLIQIFKLPPRLNLINDPPFWITIGCLFYFSCTIPLFFAQSTLKVFPQHGSLYSINFLAYTILFLFISKAFLCNPVPTK